MSQIREVAVSARPIEVLEPVVGAERVAGLRQLAASFGRRRPGCTVWNVNSTERGGGVAEMLRSIVAYARGAGIDCRWVVIPGSAEFFAITKRLHNALHGSAGDGSALGPAEQALYGEASQHAGAALTAIVRPGDIVILHDPQTAGLLPLLRKHGARVVWRCHIGPDADDDNTRAGWSFLLPYVAHAEIAVFSRRQYIPAGLAVPTRIIYPTIDPLSPKNQDMSPASAAAILSHEGIIEGGGNGQLCSFRREDGSVARVDHRSDIQRLGPAPVVGKPVVAQISRWDRLKGFPELINGFARLLDQQPDCADLILAGPNVHAVADDPEGPVAYGEVVDAWRTLPHSQRQHVHLINLPMADVDENAAIVNALQRHASIVVQSSLHEGFGLTVAEAMWKGQPVVATRVGGIQDQIVHERSGLLLDNPTDADQMALSLMRLLGNPGWAGGLGQAGRQAVRDHFLSSTSLEHYGQLLLDLSS